METVRSCAQNERRTLGKTGLIWTSGQEKTRAAKINLEKIREERVEEKRLNIPTGEGYTFNFYR